MADTRTKIILTLLLCTLPPARLAIADMVDVGLFVRDAKRDGRTWDGCPHLSQMLGQLFFNLAEPSPPDPRLMVVLPDGSRREPPGSGCNDSTDCTFRAVEVPDGVYGLLFADLDGKQHDLIDAVVVVPEKTERWLPEATRMEATLRRTIAALTPDQPDSCRPLRMVRPPRVHKKTLAECSAEAPCELDQAELGISAASAPTPWD